MIEILGAALLVFLIYYIACSATLSSRNQSIWIIFFVIASVVLRMLVPNNLNNDYYYYYKFDIFHKPSSLLSYLINEPYLYSVYAFCSLFIEEKKDIFQAMYWFNFLIDTAFFIWLILRKDVEMWKKMLLFTLHYFVFGYVLLRNGPAYILFAMYFYYTFRNKKFTLVWLTPLLHISSCLMLVTYFHQWRHYFKALLAAPIIVFLSFLVFKPYLVSIYEFDIILSKITIYSEGIPFNSIMHVSFFVFIIVLTSLSFLLYKGKMLDPILVTTIFFYICTFFISPIVAHRFSPYFLFALLFFPFEEIDNSKTILVLNRYSILLLPIFIYTLFNTHKTKLYVELFMK
ncbi:hypothetical protein [Flavobacterium sp. GP15]|uniref:hypothetical protein n=1 Tax=Flavobacterium sp. GP15 TaxID=2758567 RepID=UPI00165DA1E2|nr:hypothetical protein [Flavobacterium sp. GP15]